MATGRGAVAKSGNKLTPIRAKRQPAVRNEVRNQTIAGSETPTKKDNVEQENGFEAVSCTCSKGGL